MQIGHDRRYNGFEKVDSGYESSIWDNLTDKIDSLVPVKVSASRHRALLRLVGADAVG